MANAINKSKKVTVAMSGGVDSSITAYLLQSKGFEVTGATMRLFAKDSHIKKARMIAKKLGIKHRVVDIRDEFKKLVMQYFSREYLNGRTPNPCLQCNRLIKFGMLMDVTAQRGSYFATGHYARIVFNKNKGFFELKRALDLKKDQSYVLHMLEQKKMSKILLPLGELTKEGVRRISLELNLGIEKSEESQDICFIPDRDYAGFIARNVAPKTDVEGDIVNNSGEKLATHKGLIHYTIGQRKGLGIAYCEPLYVLGFNVKKNLLIAGTEKELYAGSMKVKNVSFCDSSYRKKQFNAQVKIRYHHQPAQAVIRHIKGRTWEVSFKERQKAITPGQGAVFYMQDKVLGGGTIERILK